MRLYQSSHTSRAMPAATAPTAPDQEPGQPTITRPALALITAAALTTVTTVTVGFAGLATASARPATHRTEHFQILNTSPTSKPSSIIATGRFTAGGVIAGGRGKNGTATAVFPGGMLKITHHTVHSKATVNPRTCLFTVRGTGTYKLGGGTGKYAKIRGTGKFVLTVLAVDARNSQGKCTTARPPAAGQQIITLHGPVKT
jgi:hypothetical protein